MNFQGENMYLKSEMYVYIDLFSINAAITSTATKIKFIKTNSDKPYLSSEGLNVEQIVKSLNSIIKENNIYLRSVSFIVYSDFVFSRVLKIPIIDKNKIRESIMWEMALFIHDIKDYYVDFKITDRTIKTNEKVYNILSCAVPKSIINDYYSIGKFLKLKIKYIDIYQNCILRVYKKALLSKKEKPVILNIKNGKTLIMIIDGNNIFYEKNICIGIDNIMQNDDIDMPSFDMLANEILRVIDFYGMENNGCSLVGTYIDTYFNFQEKIISCFIEKGLLNIHGCQDMILSKKFTCPEEINNVVSLYGLALRG